MEGRGFPKIFWKAPYGALARVIGRHFVTYGRPCLWRPIALAYKRTKLTKWQFNIYIYIYFGKKKCCLHSPSMNRGSRHIILVLSYREALKEKKYIWVFYINAILHRSILQECACIIVLRVKYWRKQSNIEESFESREILEIPEHRAASTQMMVALMT